jgi:hypothetical protein
MGHPEKLQFSVEAIFDLIAAKTIIIGNAVKLLWDQDLYMAFLLHITSVS